MRSVMVALIVGTLISGMAAAYATTTRTLDTTPNSPPKNNATR